LYPVTLAANKKLWEFYGRGLPVVKELIVTDARGSQRIYSKAFKLRVLLLVLIGWLKTTNQGQI